MRGYTVFAMFANAVACAVSVVSRAQEVPEFGSSVSSASVPAPAINIPAQPEKQDRVVATAARPGEATRKWVLVLAATDTSDRTIYGSEVRGDADLGEGKSNQFGLTYARIDPDGSAPQLNQARARAKRRFIATDSGFSVEAQLQVTRRLTQFTEPAVQMNFGKRLPANFSFGMNGGFLWRKRDQGSTTSDIDIKCGLKRRFSDKLSVGADYRMKNDVTGADDYSIGVDLFGRVSIVAGKDSTFVLSIVQRLN